MSIPFLNDPIFSYSGRLLKPAILSESKARINLDLVHDFKPLKFVYLFCTQRSFPQSLHDFRMSSNFVVSDPDPTKNAPDVKDYRNADAR